MIILTKLLSLSCGKNGPKERIKIMQLKERYFIQFHFLKGNLICQSVYLKSANSTFHLEKGPHHIELRKEQNHVPNP